MADVMQRVFGNREIHNGYATTGVQKGGQYQTLAPTNEYIPASSVYNTIIGERLDDPRYYTGDAVT